MTSCGSPQWETKPWSFAVFKKLRQRRSAVDFWLIKHLGITWQSLWLYRRCHFDGQGRDSAPRKVSSRRFSPVKFMLRCLLWDLSSLPGPKLREVIKSEERSCNESWNDSLTAPTPEPGLRALSWSPSCPSALSSTVFYLSWQSEPTGLLVKIAPSQL